MKKSQIIIVIALVGLVAGSSCKKNYTCTCTTVVGTVSGTQTHNIDNATYNDANNSCKNYQNQANNSLPGGTTCHL